MYIRNANKFFVAIVLWYFFEIKRFSHENVLAICSKKKGKKEKGTILCIFYSDLIVKRPGSALIEVWPHVSTSKKLVQPSSILENISNNIGNKSTYPRGRLKR